MEHSFIWHGEKSIARAMILRFGIFKSVRIIVYLDPCNGFFGMPFMQIFIFKVNYLKQVNFYICQVYILREWQD